MPLIVLLILIGIGAVIIFELFWTCWKRLLLIIKIRRACRKYGFRAKFRRFPFLSVLFFKGRLDLTVESDIDKYAIVIITSRHKSGKFVFFEDRMEIWKRRKILLHRVSMGRNGTVVAGRSMAFDGGVAYKGKIKLSFRKIVENYPLHQGICIINPAPNMVCISYGTTHSEIHDGDRIHSGFKVYGLSGFLRQLNTEDIYGI
ncbi:MAG: hypothetical protein IJX51_06535 [Clostridia bacterium]|nr:hypothetical protein [Clostridia bacterium]